MSTEERTYQRRRRPPTASERRRRQDQVSQQEHISQQECHIEEQEISQQQEVNQQEVTQQEVTQEELTQQEIPQEIPQQEQLQQEQNMDLDEDQPSGEVVRDDEQAFPGGPTDTHILENYTNHVAVEIWQGTERAVLDVVCHTKKLLQWTFTTEAGRQLTNIFRDASIFRLREISYQSPNRHLISAFVERWHPETNTFHMPFGEMTVTLEDVRCVTGLPVTGRPLELKDGMAAVRSIDLVRRYLGVTGDEARLAFVGARGEKLKLEWLRSTFMDRNADNSTATLVFAARAYLLYLLGCTIFADKTGTRVNPSYLHFLEDLDDLDEIAWGTATLAHLFRQLGQASNAGVSKIAGYSTLLEAWIYERFPSLRPAHNTFYEEGNPLAMRWQRTRHPGPNPDIVRSHRELLDSLRPNEVEWRPYVRFRQHFPRPTVTWYYGCIQSLDIVEPHYPDRVLRQLGHMQTIPQDPINWLLARTGETAATLASMFEMWDSHLLSPSRRGILADPEWCCGEGYYDWYRHTSHVRVQNPALRSTFRGNRVASDNIEIWHRSELAADRLEEYVDRWNSGEHDLASSYIMDGVHEAYFTLRGLTLEEYQQQRTRGGASGGRVWRGESSRGPPRRRGR